MRHVGNTVMKRDFRKFIVAATVCLLALASFLVWTGQQVGENSPVLGANETSEPSSHELADRGIRQESGSPRLAEQRYSDIASSESAQRKTDFAEGEVVAQWGDFVPMRIVNENCRDVEIPVARNGGIEQVYSVECERNHYVDHAYGDLPTSALRELARTDGAAALILGDRLQRTLPGRPEIVQRLYVHSFVLTGEEQAFDALVDYQSGAVVQSDGELDVDRAVTGWIWARIGEELGLRSRSEVEHYADALAAVGFTDLSPAEEHVEKWLDDLNNRRMAATGEGL